MKLKKGDFLIVAAVIMLAAAVWLWPFFSQGGSEAYIEQSGSGFYVSLSEDAEYELSGCVAAVEDGEIFIKETDCPDRVCEETGRISRAGEAIICVPNKVSIKIAGAAEVDAIAG